MWATSLNFKKLPKVNHHLMGENSPNLVTLQTLTISATPCSAYLPSAQICS
jgi:hypothetical protein